MSLSTRLHTSWELFQRSLEVLRTQPRLMLFPVVSTLCAIAIALFFFAPILLLAFGGAWAEQHGWTVTKEYFNAAFYVYGAVIYLVSMVVATFFNVAFYHEIMRALGGETVSLGGGLRFALTRWQSILMWSLLAGTVGLVIRAIEERLGWLGKIMMGFVGVVWSVAAVFAIPVIIRQGETNPFTVLKNSAATLKKTWGESLTGFLGIQLGGAALVLISVVFGVIGIVMAVVLHQGGIAVAIGALWVLSMIAVSFFLGMATHVYRCALYVYASEGIVPAPYTTEMMNAGWKIKQG